MTAAAQLDPQAVPANGFPTTMRPLRKDESSVCVQSTGNDARASTSGLRFDGAKLPAVRIASEVPAESATETGAEWETRKGSWRNAG